MVFSSKDTVRKGFLQSSLNIIKSLFSIVFVQCETNIIQLSALTFRFNFQNFIFILPDDNTTVEYRHFYSHEVDFCCLHNLNLNLESSNVHVSFNTGNISHAFFQLEMVVHVSISACSVLSTICFSNLWGRIAFDKLKSDNGCGFFMLSFKLLQHFSFFVNPLLLLHAVSVQLFWEG